MGDDAFHLLAHAMRPSLQKMIISSTTETQKSISLESIVESFTFLSKSQSTLKTIDGASHEFYQRSHSLETSTKTAVKGRVARSAARTGCCADALFACELLDLITYPNDHQNLLTSDEDEEGELEEGTLDLAGGREILLNVTLSTAPVPLEVIVLYEAEYVGGGGIYHGGIDGLLSSPTSKRPRGRILVVIRDGYEVDLSQTLDQLDHSPEFVDLEEGLMAQEVACVNGILWRSAEALLEVLEPILKNQENDKTEGDSSTKTNVDDLPAIHFVARSLAGGVASLAAAMLNGSIPLPPVVRAKRKRKKKVGHKKKVRQFDNQSLSPSSSQNNGDDGKDAVTSKASLQKEEDSGKAKSCLTSLQGFGKGRISAVVIGAPPSLSSNVETPFITSVIHGDDIVCRVTKDSLDKLRRRTSRLWKKNILTKRVSWMTDTLNLAVSGIQSHAHGSEGEEAKLSLAGRVYLVRPRRISGGVSSMHEIGAAGGREALRASVLWSLRDVLLSKSLWVHHSLEAYIAGLDKVQLRNFLAGDEDLL